MTLERRVNGRSGQGTPGNQGNQGNAGCRTGIASERRSNPALAAVVDQAIRYDAERGAALAWAYLARHGVPPETILRVLAAPAAGERPRRAASTTTREGAALQN